MEESLDALFDRLKRISDSIGKSASEVEEAWLQQAIEASKADSHPKHPEYTGSSSSSPEDHSNGTSKRRNGDCGPEVCAKKIRTSSPSRPDDGNEFAGCVIKPNHINETFEHIYVREDTISALNVLSLSIKDPGAFKVGILSKHSSIGVLLYGPPGTGKTLLVRALAKQANAKMLAISGADIRSRYVGDGEKKIKHMFEYARQHHPCIIFIDEADSVFRSRSADALSTGHVSDLNQFLVEMDGIQSRSTDSPMIIAASNRPFDIDEGILRRLGRRIMVDLPDVYGREAILRIHLSDEKTDPQLDLAEIARATHDYTGSDLRDLVWQAAVEAVQEMHQPRLGTSSPETSERGKMEAVRGADRVLRREHFLQAKRAVCAAPKSDVVAKLNEFHAKFGSAGGRGRQGVYHVDASSSSIRKAKMPEVD